MRHPTLILDLYKGRNEIARLLSEKDEDSLAKQYSQFLREHPEPLAKIDDSSIYLNPDDMFVSASIAVRGNMIFEEDVTKLLLMLLNEKSNFVDVGANVGWFTLLGAKKAKQVWAFEPEPANFSLLEKSVRKNGLENVTLFPFCVSDSDGVVQLSISESSNRTTHSIVRNVGSRRIAVKSVALDSIFPASIIDVLKIDVEGAEPLVLLGAQRMIREKRIRNILMEWNPEVWRDRDYLLNAFDLQNTNRKPLREIPKKFCNVYLTPK